MTTAPNDAMLAANERTSAEAPDAFDPTPEQVAFYDQRWQGRPFIPKLALLRVGAILTELSALPVAAPRMVDLGCGTGWFTAMVQDLGSVTGIDQAVSVARQRYPHLSFHEADLERWVPDLPPGDVVFSQEVIEHLRDQRHYLDVAAALLKPEGYLILTTPNAKVTRGLTTDAWQRKHLTQPVENHLRPNELIALVSERFKVLKVRTIHPGVGRRHVFRILHCNAARFLRPALLRQMYGLHTVLVAQKRS
jgi:2-polyprenyl-3-methyl-5-hydroxy-6-metoxy-1,4-benzoquinol methylase